MQRASTFNQLLGGGDCEMDSLDLRRIISRAFVTIVWMESAQKGATRDVEREKSRNPDEN